MRIVRKLWEWSTDGDQNAIAVTVLLLAAFVATSAQATSVTYDVLTIGSLDSVRLEDSTAPITPTACPTSGSVSCLQSPVSISSASATLDASTHTLSNLTIQLSGTGVLAMEGLNGYERVEFTGTTFQSLVPTVLLNPQVVGGATFYDLTPVMGMVSVDQVDLFLSGNLTNTPDMSLAYFATAVPGVTVTAGINASGELTLGLQGLDIGTFVDPATGQNPVTAKADFNLVVSAASAVPEPTAAALFGIGIAAIATSIRPRRSIAARQS